MTIRSSEMAAEHTVREQIKADMLRRIELGEWRINARIPTLDALQTVYPYSRMTISQAARDLVAEGILETRGRAGTVVLRVPSVAAIGLVANYVAGDHGFAEFTHAMVNRLRTSLAASGRSVRVYFESPDFLRPGGQLPASLGDDMGRHELAGLITVASNLPEWERRHPEQRLALPMVNIGYQPSRHRVYIDFAGAVSDAVKELAAAGCRRIGLVSSPHGSVPVAFRQTVAALGLRTAAAWVPAAAPELMSEAYGYDALRQLWSGEDRPDGLVIPDDIAAKGVAQATLALGVQVPEQLRLICLANEGIAQFYPVPMMTVVIPLSTITSRAVEMLEHLINDPDMAPENVLVTAQPGRTHTPLEAHTYASV